MFGPLDQKRIAFMTNTLLGSRLREMSSSHAGSLIVVESEEPEAQRLIGIPVTRDRE